MVKPIIGVLVFIIILVISHRPLFHHYLFNMFVFISVFIMHVPHLQHVFPIESMVPVFPIVLYNLFTLSNVNYQP